MTYFVPWHIECDNKRWKLRTFKFHWRCFWHRHTIQEFEHRVAQQPSAQLFFMHRSRASYELLRSFGVRKTSISTRLNDMLNALECMYQVIGPKAYQTLCETGCYPLAHFGPHCIELQCNPLNYQEGFFSLVIRDTERSQWVYLISMVHRHHDDIIGASVQGPRYEDATDYLKLWTKKWFGLRPQQLLITAFSYFAYLTGAQAFGVPHRLQIKAGSRQARLIYFNYDELWQEYGGVQHDGFWQLPVPPIRKAIEDISSNKRSQYRKRYALLDDIYQQMQQALTHNPAASRSLPSP